MRLHPRANPIQRFHVALLVSCTFARWICIPVRRREREREGSWILSDNDAFVHYNCSKRLALPCNYTLFHEYLLLAFECKNSECIWDLKKFLSSQFYFSLSGRIYERTREIWEIIRFSIDCQLTIFRFVSVFLLLLLFDERG